MLDSSYHQVSVINNQQEASHDSKIDNKKYKRVEMTREKLQKGQNFLKKSKQYIKFLKTTKLGKSNLKKGGQRVASEKLETKRNSQS